MAWHALVAGRSAGNAAGRSGAGQTSPAARSVLVVVDVVPRVAVVAVHVVDVILVRDPHEEHRGRFVIAERARGAPQIVDVGTELAP